MNLKRFLSLALALIMVMGMLPMNLVHAEETVYVAQIGSTGYESLEAALDAATKGQVVQLLEDINLEENTGVYVVNGVTLDLNGKTLTAKHASAFQGNHIVDSTNGTGVLKIGKGYLLLQRDNAAMPIWNGADGYVFTRHTKFQEMVNVGEGTMKYTFLPHLNPELHELLAAGTAVSGVEMKVEVSWYRNGNERVYQTFSYSDALLNTVLNSYENGRYGRVFTISLRGVPEDVQLKFTVRFDTASGAKYSIPSIVAPGRVETGTDVTTNEEGKVTETVTVNAGEQASAVVPEGTQLEANTTKLTLTVTEMENSAGNITAGEGKSRKSVDVHMDGVAADNKVPMLVTLKEFAPAGQNLGNLKLYHVENGATNAMAQVETLADVNDHNEFYYDPATGDVTMALATFSEITALSADDKAWEGNFDYSWYTNAVAAADGEAVTEFVIANADQLAGFSAIVGGMNGKTRDSFEGKTVKLIADINLGDAEEKNNPDLIFYPIGYSNNKGSYTRTTDSVTSSVSSFEGIFDGNGHTIANFYQNTWEMFGDYNDGYSAGSNYYKDAMGLFGYVVGTRDTDGNPTGGIIKNLTVENFSSDGEFTPTGVIAAYAVNSTFENIAITNCNPRVYNTGNGGIVGIGGNSDDPDTYKLTFTNITIDNTNKISALWGSWDVACGGLVGMFRGAGHVDMTNCHVAAQMDVYNDVCGNYQYYWYRYSGMMVGTNKNMITDEDGYTVPETSKFHAEGCTVHFGSWNNYWYCELVANSLASYTHDHQFSRLEQISSLDEIKSGDTWTKTGNFLLISGDTKTCYHIVKNADGTLRQHSHDDYNNDGTPDFETVNGESIPVENNRIVYLPFNQLFTGYGWGVKHIPVYNGENYAFEGITILDREIADSVVKFEKAETAPGAYFSGVTVKIGDLFTDAGAGVAIKPGNIQVFVSPVDDESTVSAKFEPAQPTEDGSVTWTEGTLTFSGVGEATITITDYYFCIPTTITVEIKSADRFAAVFPNNGIIKETGVVKTDFLYRVGNQNAVSLSSLFKLAEGVEETQIDNVSVTVEKVAGNASGKCSDNPTLTNGAIQFSGTGVVKVTINADGANSVTLNLEVVDATNVTSATGSSDKDVVLLNNVTFTDGYLYYKNMTLYGNGFEIDITGAPHSDLKDANDKDSNRSAYCNIWMVNSTFNNVAIIGSVYPEVGMTADSDYGNAAIRAEGECYILNSYISNTRVPLRVQGDTTLVNTVVDGGRYANIELRFGKLTLDGVTTINTVRKGSDGKTDVIGFGIVIHDEAANASIAVIGDGLKQYNWTGANEHKSVLSGDTYLSKAYNLVFHANNNDTIYFDYNSDRYVNTGVLCLCKDFTQDLVTGLDDRYCQKVSGYDAWVLTYDNSKHTAWFEESIGVGSVDYEPNQYAVLPKYSGNGAQTVEFTKGETYYFDTSVLKAEKFGAKLNVSSVVMNGTTYNYGDKIPLTEGGVYEVVYTVVDPYNYSADGSSTLTENHTVSITVKAIAKDAEILAPKFTFIDQNGKKYGSATVKIGDKTYVMPDVTAADPTTNSMGSINIGSTSISGTTVYFPVTTGYTVRSGSNFNRYYPLFTGINITDYTIAGDTKGTTYTSAGDYTSLVGSSGKKFIIPENTTQSNCGDYVKSSGQSGNAAGNSSSGWQGAGYNSKNYGGTYLKSGNTSASSGNDANGYERIVWVEYSFNAGNGDVYYYRIGYHCNKVSAQTCFTADTLITLADGSQKRIDETTAQDQFMVWDFYNGEYTAAPASILQNYGVERVNVLTLNFEDGTAVETINGHGFYDVDADAFVIIDETNVDDYIGHSFVKQNGTENISVKLVGYECEEEETEVWSILTAYHYNAVIEGMLSLTPEDHGYTPDYLMPFEMGEGMKYDEAAMVADIEKYGLYTYEEFADIITYEQFDAFNMPILKVSVGKGYITFEDILEILEIYA